MAWTIYNNKLCPVHIPLLLRNNKQNQIHLQEYHYENVFNHFIV